MIRIRNFITKDQNGNIISQKFQYKYGKPNLSQEKICWKDNPDYYLVFEESDWIDFEEEIEIVYKKQNKVLTKNKKSTKLSK